MQGSLNNLQEFVDLSGWYRGQGVHSSIGPVPHWGHLLASASALVLLPTYLKRCNSSSPLGIARLGRSNHHRSVSCASLTSLDVLGIGCLRLCQARDSMSLISKRKSLEAVFP